MTLNENWERAGGEERTEFYRTWRTGLGFGSVGDADQIEYAFRGGRVVPVAVIELSVADPEWCHPDPSSLFLEKVLEKVGQARAQGRMLRHVSEAIEAPLYIVVVILDDLDAGYWVYNVTAERGWRKMAPGEFVGWLRALHQAA